MRVSFDTDSNDFDPFYAPDGKSVYFFSNRAGGFGGDDIYVAKIDSLTGQFGDPKNLGPVINTKGNEWTPVPDASGKHLYFSSNGHGGYGGEDLFVSVKSDMGFLKPINLGASVNGPADDFDMVLLPENILIFTSTRGADTTARLYSAIKKEKGYENVQLLPEIINANGFWTLGPAYNQQTPGYLYFSGHLKESIGRTDVYRIKYSVK